MTWKRVATAAVLIPLVVSAVWWGPRWLVGLMILTVMVLTLREFFAVAERAGVPGFRVLTILTAVILFLPDWVLSIPAQWLFSREQLNDASGGPQWFASIVLGASPDLVVPAFLAVIVVLASFRGKATKNPLAGVGTSLVGLLLIVLPLLALWSLLVGEYGKRTVFFVLCLVWAGDTAAYFVGRAIGRHKLAPAISPGKTWEGAVANVAASLAAGYLFARWVPVGLTHMLVMAGLASVAGQIGDLFESACKRAAGVKDSGTLLPGHGGMWDRVDALLFAAPTVAWYLAIMRN